MGAAVIALAVVALVGDGVVDRASAPPTVLADRAVEAPDADALERLDRRPAQRRPATTDPVCSGLRDLSCFAWSVRAGDVAGVVAAGDLVISSDSGDGSVTARSARDGSTVWTTTGSPSDLSGNLITVGDLVIHQTTQDRTVGLELATGQERWATSALAGVLLYEARELDGTIVVQGEVGTASSDGHLPQNLTALDPATGEVRWQLEGASASLAAGGRAVVVDGDGHLEVLAPGGEVLWELDIEIDRYQGGGASALGHVVMVYELTGEVGLLRLRDGADLGAVDGYALATDETNTLLRVHEPAAAGGAQLMLVDEDGEVWRVPTEGTDRMCFPMARLGPRTVEVDLCGDALTLDRATGEERGRTAAASDPRGHDGVGHGSFVHQLGDHLLVLDDPDDWEGDVLLLDVDGGEIARLPQDTWPVTPRYGDWDVDLGGIAVLQSPGWLVGVELADRAVSDTRGPLVRTARGRMGVSAK